MEMDTIESEPNSPEWTRLLLACLLLLKAQGNRLERTEKRRQLWGV